MLVTINNLIPMVDFVLLENDINAIKNYANFIKQKPEKWMFVPCDEDGNVLEEPKNYREWLNKKINTPYDLDLSKYEQYQQAKERVLFEHEYNEEDVELFTFYSGKLEYMSTHNFKLTETAKDIIYKT